MMSNLAVIGFDNKHQAYENEPHCKTGDYINPGDTPQIVIV